MLFLLYGFRCLDWFLQLRLIHRFSACSFLPFAGRGAPSPDSSFPRRARKESGRFAQRKRTLVTGMPQCTYRTFGVSPPDAAAKRNREFSIGSWGSVWAQLWDRGRARSSRRTDASSGLRFLNTMKKHRKSELPCLGTGGRAPPSYKLFGEKTEPTVETRH